MAVHWKSSTQVKGKRNSILSALHRAKLLSTSSHSPLPLPYTLVNSSNDDGDAEDEPKEQ